MVAMTLMPDASYCEALRRLAGLLVQVPFAREWHVPTPKVITCWRVPVPPSVMEELFWQAAGPLVADDANRKAFGCSGTSSQHGTGSAPFPQIQAVVVTARAGRAALGAICGRARAREQALLARLIRRRPQVFADR